MLRKVGFLQAVAGISATLFIATLASLFTIVLPQAERNANELTATRVTVLHQAEIIQAKEQALATARVEVANLQARAVATEKTIANLKQDKDFQTSRVQEAEVEVANLQARAVATEKTIANLKQDKDFQTSRVQEAEVEVALDQQTIADLKENLNVKVTSLDKLRTELSGAKDQLLFSEQFREQFGLIMNDLLYLVPDGATLIIEPKPLVGEVIVIRTGNHATVSINPPVPDFLIQWHIKKNSEFVQQFREKGTGISVGLSPINWKIRPQ